MAIWIGTSLTDVGLSENQIISISWLAIYKWLKRHILKWYDRSVKKSGKNLSSLLSFEAF